MSETNTSTEADKGLMLNTSPGAVWWTREADGTYSYKSFALGGVGGGRNTAAEVAKRIFSRAGLNMPAVVSELQRRGWQDILDLLAGLEQEKRQAQIAGLEGRAKDLGGFIKAHEGKDYWYYRKLAYEDLRRPDGTYPPDEEISVRRLHMAATAMMGSAEILVETEKQIKELEDAIAAPAEQNGKK